MMAGGGAEKKHWCLAQADDGLGRARQTSSCMWFRVSDFNQILMQVAALANDNGETSRPLTRQSHFKSFEFFPTPNLPQVPVLKKIVYPLLATMK